jgi:hydroxyethylthiazole kinase-like uncharacterized protein yjeF
MDMRRAGHSDTLHFEASTRALERQLLAALPSRTLMKRAGLQLAQLGRALAPAGRRAWVLAGPGHNGGDGLEAAMQLNRLGFEVTLSLLGEAQKLPPDAAAAWRDALDMGLQASSLEQAPALEPQDLIIDALLGLGCSRAPQGLLAQGIAAMRASPALVLAADLPSGLNGDTGQTWGNAVRAHHTLSLLTLKPGCFTAEGRDHAGQVWLSTLGCGASCLPADARLLGPGCHAPFTRRSRARHNSHKGSHGDVLVIGGRQGMMGAAALAASAALAAGAGRVWCCPSDGSEAPLLAQRPEIMGAERAWADKAWLAGRTVVLGCGAGALEPQLLLAVLAHAHRLVLDADALNALAALPQAWPCLQGRAAGRTVLTPHPLEAARLLRCTSPEVQRNRLGAARALADRAQATVVLKGSGSVICSPWALCPDINLTGHDGLASPGTGDVLAGWLGGWWAGMETSPSVSRLKPDGPNPTPDTPLSEGAAPLLHHLAGAAVSLHGQAAEMQARWPLRALDLIEAMLALSQAPSPARA